MDLPPSPYPKASLLFIAVHGDMQIQQNLLSSLNAINYLAPLIKSI